jgi:hypothetical protein
MNHTGATIAFFTMLFGVAVVAVLVSQKAQTSAVLQALGSGVGNVIGAATAPVTGASTGGQSSAPLTLSGGGVQAQPFR